MPLHLLSTLILSLIFTFGCSSLIGGGSSGEDELGSETPNNETGDPSNRSIPPYLFTKCDKYSEAFDGSGALHVDAVNGNDTTGDGTEGNPFQSFDRVMEVLPEEGTALFHDGEYGDITVGVEACPASGICPESGRDCNYGMGHLCPKTMFSEWTTIRAAEGASPTFGKLSVGSDTCEFWELGCANGGYYWLEDVGEGVAEIYMRFQGLHFTEGVGIHGSHHVEVIDSKVEIPGPWNTSVSVINRGGIGLRFASDVLIECNEVTNVGTGIGIANSTYRNIVRNNHVHHGAQDGIVIVSAHDLLVEGNVIHNFDDGFDDDDPNGGEMLIHNDGIQLYPIMENDIFWIHNVTIRGNTIYDVADQGIMVNLKATAATDLSEFQYYNLVIENNVIGFAHAPVLHAKIPFNGFILRHNSFVESSTGFQSMYRWVPNGGNSSVLLPESGLPMAGIEVYGNIFYEWPHLTGYSEYDRLDHNIVYGPQTTYPTSGLGVGSMRLDESPFESSTLHDGILKTGSAAIDAGTQLDATFYAVDDQRVAYDIFGTTRDARPDMGAYESPDRDPGQQSVVPPPSSPTTFVNDFSSAFLWRINPFLYDVDTAALTWESVLGFQDFQVYPKEGQKENRLIPSNCAGGDRFIVSEQSFEDQHVSFDVMTRHNNGGESAILLYQDTDNYYMVDLAGGEFIRRMNGSETVLSSAGGLQISNQWSAVPKHDVEITVYPSGTGIQFAVLIDGSQELVINDNNGTAISRFTEGKIGFKREQTGTSCEIASYDNVVVEKL